jgi:hypothetical protein
MRQVTKPDIFAGNCYTRRAVDDWRDEIEANKLQEMNNDPTSL